MKVEFIHRRQPTGASTLVDTLLATMLLGIMMSSLMATFFNGFLSIRMSRENQRATQIILEKVETLRLYNWDQLNSTGFIPSTFSAVYDPQAHEGQRGNVYNGTVVITNVPFSANYSDRMRQVSVTVTWTTGKINRQRTLVTYVSKDGLQNYVY